MSTRKYPHIINVFLVLTVVRVEVECGRIRDIPARLVGDDSDIIADLVLIRIAFERVERIAHGDVSRPGHAGVSAKGIEKLGVRVIGSVARVIPNGIKPPIRRY